MLMEPGTESTSSGLVKSYSIAAAAVTILLTEPGSNGDERAGCRSGGSPPADVLRRVESVVVGHRQDFAGLGVEHHRRDILGAGGVLACCTCCWT